MSLDTSRSIVQVLGIVAAGLLLLSGCASQQPQMTSGRDNSARRAAESAAADSASQGADSQFQAAAKRPPTPKTLYAYSQILSSQGKDAQAEFVLRKIITDEPKFMPAYCDLAEVQMRQRRIEEAIRTLSAGLKLAPKEVVLLNDRGMCYMLLRNWDLALPDFARAVALAPDDARYRSNLAAALGMLGRYDESLAVYMQIMPAADAQHNVDVLAQTRGDRKPPVAVEKPQVAVTSAAAVAPAEPAAIATTPVAEAMIVPEAAALPALTEQEQVMDEPIAAAAIEEDVEEFAADLDATIDTGEILSIPQEHKLAILPSSTLAIDSPLVTEDWQNEHDSLSAALAAAEYDQSYIREPIASAPEQEDLTQSLAEGEPIVSAPEQHELAASLSDDELASVDAEPIVLASASPVRLPTPELIIEGSQDEAPAVITSNEQDPSSDLSLGNEVDPSIESELDQSVPPTP